MTKSGKYSVIHFLFSVFCFLLIILLVGCGGDEDTGPSELALKLTQEAATAAVETEAPSEEEITPPEPVEADNSISSPTQEPVSEPVEEEPVDEAPVEEKPVEESGEQAESTPEPTPQEGVVTATLDPALEEAFATATARAVEIQQTVDAATVAEAAQEAAEDAALAPIRDELRALGVDPDQGQLGFTHPPISLQSVEFESYAFDNKNALTVAQDFVMAADITWESRFAESGCGFVVRSNGDENALDQYIIGLTRGAQGHVLFAEQKQGDVELKDVTDIYANGIDPRFEWQSGTTNRLAVIGRGQQFDIFSNGTYLGTITAGAGYEEGFVAFFAVNRSGGVMCDFNNAYLWKLN